MVVQSLSHSRDLADSMLFLSGDAIFVNQSNATAMQLTYVNSAGNAIIRVDNESFVPYNQKRDTVRLDSTDYFPVGTVIVIDAIHIPFGCSVSLLLDLSALSTG